MNLNYTELAPVGATAGNTGLEADEGNEFSSLLTTPNLIAAGLLLVAVILFIAIVRTRNSQRSRDKSWELQEATWGIQDNVGWEDTLEFGQPAPSSPPPTISQQNQTDIYAAAQRIEASNPYDRNVYQQQQPVLQPQNENLMKELAGQRNDAVKPNIDTSFLDDLL